MVRNTLIIFFVIIIFSIIYLKFPIKHKESEKFDEEELLNKYGKLLN